MSVNFQILNIINDIEKLNEETTTPNNEHSEQARAPHTNGPRDVPRCGALSLIKRL